MARQISRYLHRSYLNMESTRQQKFSRLIQKDMSEIFQRESFSLFNGAMVSVTIVRMSPDLGLAKVYLSFMLAKDPEALLAIVRGKTAYFRNLLGKKIKHQVRKIPELNFYLDDSSEYASKMDQLFDELDIPPSDTEDEE